MTSRLSIIGFVALTVACGGGHGGGGASTGGRAGGGAAGHSQTAGGNGGGGQPTGGAAGDGRSGGAAGQSTGGAAGGGGSAGASLGGSSASGGDSGSRATGGGAGVAAGGTAGSSRATGGTVGGAGGAAGGATAGAGGSSSLGGSSGDGGKGGLSPSDPNVVTVTVDHGPDTSSYINGPFATITLCEPGTNNCQTIEHLLIDTGSTGIRVLESVVKLKLPIATGPSGKNLAQCLPFMSGSSWGPVRTADFKIGGETASKMRVQLIGGNTYPLASTCSGTPITDSDSLGSNGILGIGLDVQDCGPACASTGRTNPGLYYECSSASAGGCAAVAVPVAEQIANPIASFAVDNNGSFFQFPDIPAAGVPSVDGFLVFGIGTRSNNSLGNAKIVPVDANGFSTSVYPVGGTRYKSFLDSGSNGLYFLSSTVAKIAVCSTGSWTGFYCPQTTTDVTAGIVVKDGSAVSVSFSVANASKFSMSNYAFNNLAAPMLDTGGSVSIGFDWGFPFYYGRTVFTALQGKDTPGGAGPYFAF